MSVEMVEVSEPVRPAGALQQNRVFLDFFWDLAKPEQDVRLKAVEGLVDYLKTGGQADELEYTFKRLVDGLAHTREAARPGFSLALGQVLSAFRDVPLQSTLDRIRAKHDLQAVKKKFSRNAMFGNLFGVLALHQSGRLATEPQVLLGCVQLLQSLSQHKQHLKDLPSKTMMDILVEVPEEVFEEVLLAALQADLSAAFSTPEQLQLLLVALRHFPHSLKPKKLKKLLGSSTIINADNVPKLTGVLKMAARSMKKENVLPAVVLDLLKLSLKEDSFQLFWTKAIAEGMFKEPSGPTHFMSFRLLGSALPLLSLAQLKDVLSGGVMLHYGEHVVSAQKPDRFKFSPEMEALVSSFLEECRDADRQLAAMVGFSSLTHQGAPVVPSVWRVVQHLQPAALRRYVDWLKSAFLQPRLEQLLDFSTRKQKAVPEAAEQKENAVFRLRKWIVSRLCSVVDNHQVKKPQELVMEVARFVFFHAFFSAKKASPEIPETEETASVPLDERTRGVLVNSFFSLLMSMHHLPLADEAPDGAAAAAAGGQKRVVGVTADGTMWIEHLVQFAQVLLSRPKLVQPRQPFSPEQSQAWDSMLESVAALKKKTQKGPAAEGGAFQQLFLLVGMHLFQAPEELLDILKDLQSCVDQAQEKKTKKTKKKADASAPAEPQWVEVMVDILLSLLSRQSRHIRQVCRTVFASICPHVNAAALAAILDVLDPEQDQDDALLFSDDTAQKTEDDEDEEMEAKDSEDETDEEDDDGEEEEEEEEEQEEEDDDDDEEEKMEVDQNFRVELMKVLQQKNAAADEEDDGSSEEDMDDDAMMKLDQSLASLFSEQKKKNQAKMEEKTKLQRERMLVREFKIKVLDLVEVFVARQAGSPLVISLLTPLLAIIEKGMSSNSELQEQDFLRRTADIFRNQLCRSKVYCRTAGDRQEALHDLLDKLLTKTQKLADSSVSLYYFSACLYLVKVLRGAPPAEAREEQQEEKAAVNDPSFMGNVDVDRVSGLFREALASFLSRRKSPLTSQMFLDLFTRFPVVCVSLLDTAVQSITAGVREHQQGQACVLVLRALQSREVQRLLSGPRWAELCGNVCKQLEEALRQLGPPESKAAREKLVKVLELCQFLVKHVNQQKLGVELEPLQKALQPLTDTIAFKKTGKMEDTYWTVMRHFGVTKPKVEKTKAEAAADPDAAPKKKKGFLPESKKRKKRNKPVLEPAGHNPAPKDQPGAEKGPNKKKADKKAKRKRAADGAAAAVAPGPAKKSRTQSENKPENKRKRKRKGKPKKDGGQK